MVRDPNITKYFLIIVNSLLPLSWDPGQASPLITRLFLYLDLFSHLQDASISMKSFLAMGNYFPPTGE